MIKHSDTVDKISTALVKAQAAFKPAKKTAENPFLKSMYADLSDVLNAIKQPLIDNKIAIQQSSHIDVDGMLIMVTRAWHESGQWIESSTNMKVPSTSGKNPNQDMGATLTYARRYCLSQLFSIETGEDTDGATAGDSKKDAAVAAAKAVKAKKQAVATGGDDAFEL